MHTWLESLSLSHWFILAALLLASGMLGTAGTLLGAALAALLVGVMLAVNPQFSWQEQFFTFATFAVVFTFIYWKRFKTPPLVNTHPPLEQRAAHLIGKTLALDHSLSLGRGTVRINDDQWPVRCDEPVEAGATIRIIGVDGNVLKILLVRNA